MDPADQLEDQMQEHHQFNSDSGEEQFDFDEISDDKQQHQQQLDGGNVKALGWVQWFCSLEGHQALVEVDYQFLKDKTNLIDLNKQGKFSKDKLKACLRLILSPEQITQQHLQDEGFIELNQEAADVYGLIHRRFLHSPRGLAKLHQNFLSGVYGSCPRALCDRQKVLPVGLSDQLKVSRFKSYCPRCEEAYVPKQSSDVNVDGAYFGTSIPHVFMQHFTQTIILPPKIYYYEPKIYGFHLAGKRGSKLYQPVNGTFKQIESSMQGLDIEDCNRAWRAKQQQSAVQKDTDKHNNSVNHAENTSLLNDSPTKSINFNPSPADCGESKHQQPNHKKNNKKRSK